ncbi:MAG: hypothetical protein DI640_12435 [Sphingomonas taxi]|uniref:Alginate export domain-containing protein n=1 Tax=Sphingomonas taxi TaxID=1549858 RepID=A0A2W5AWQ4_9SPHN|nr:MAG: hypothetical protein DI640_12435 [Sphingomonas taxi]
MAPLEIRHRSVRPISAKHAQASRFLQQSHPISSRLSFTGRYEHLIAGPALTNAGYKNSDFLAGWISYRF